MLEIAAYGQYNKTVTGRHNLRKGKKVKNFINEFKEFINRGNVVDMAVGVVIGSAFSAIVTALVDNIISPLIGLIFFVDFSELSFGLGSAQIEYGAFIMAVLNFLIVAFVLFLFVKAMNKMRSLGKKEEEAPAEPTVKNCPFCLSEIPVDATRCAFCTSELSVKTLEEAETAE